MEHGSGSDQILERGEAHMKRDFEDFLQQKFGEQNPHVLDDDWPDAYSEWCAELPIDDLIRWANEWGAK